MMWLCAVGPSRSRRLGAPTCPPRSGSTCPAQSAAAASRPGRPGPPRRSFRAWLMRRPRPPASSAASARPVTLRVPARPPLSPPAAGPPELPGRPGWPLVPVPGRCHNVTMANGGSPGSRWRRPPPLLDRLERLDPVHRLTGSILSMDRPTRAVDSARPDRSPRSVPSRRWAASRRRFRSARSGASPRSCPASRPAHCGAGVIPAGWSACGAHTPSPVRSVSRRAPPVPARDAGAIRNCLSKTKKKKTRKTELLETGGEARDFARGSRPSAAPAPS